MADIEDQPLSALVKASAKLSDDTPLSLLASSIKPKASNVRAAPKAGVKPLPKNVAKPKVKLPDAVAKRKRPEGGESSSGSSSSSSSDDSDESSDGGPRASQKKRQKLLKKKSSMALGEDGEDTANMVVKQRDRSVKHQAVADLLCRWWYVLPDWPPNDEEYYEKELVKRRLRQVTIQQWEWVADEDSQGMHKVYQLSQFRGVFRDGHGNLHDLRPQESCPCYANMMKKEMHELYDLLVGAYENQLKALTDNSKTAKDIKTKLEQELRTSITRYREKAFQARQVAGAPRK